jgi:uncharacterized protein YdaU (DUF1376 family)
MIKKQAPAFQHYPGDFLSDPQVALMNPAEVGMYWLLVNWCWKLGELPDDLEVLAIYARASNEHFERIWNSKVSKLFLKEKGKFFHPHLEEEKKKHRARKKQAKEASAVRWSKQKTSDDASALPTHCSDDAPAYTESMLTVSPSSSSSSSSSSSDKEALNTSVFNGGEPPILDDGGDEYFKHQIWQIGVRLMVATGGMKEAQARSFLGKLAKEYGNEKLAEALSVTIARNAINPHEFVVAVLKERKNERYPQKKTHQETMNDYAEWFKRLESEGGETRRLGE